MEPAMRFRRGPMPNSLQSSGTHKPICLPSLFPRPARPHQRVTTEAPASPNLKNRASRVPPRRKQRVSTSKQIQEIVRVDESPSSNSGEGDLDRSRPSSWQETYSRSVLAPTDRSWCALREHCRKSLTVGEGGTGLI